MFNKAITPDFRDKLLLVVADKLVFAAILLIAAYWLNGRLETIKSELTDQRSVAQERRALLSRQLSEFYWPLYFRLRKDTDVWEVFPNARDLMGSALDEGILRPNRQEMARLIDEKVYLAHADAELLEKFQRLLKHIAVSETLRATGSKNDPQQVDPKYGWPSDVLPAVEKDTLKLQREFDSLSGDGD